MTRQFANCATFSTIFNQTYCTPSNRCFDMKLLRKEIEFRGDHVIKAMERRWPLLYAHESFLALYVYSHIGNEINCAIKTPDPTEIESYKSLHMA